MEAGRREERKWKGKQEGEREGGREREDEGQVRRLHFAYV